MLLIGKKPSISQKPCWPETGSRMVSAEVQPDARDGKTRVACVLHALRTGGPRARLVFVWDPPSAAGGCLSWACRCLSRCPGRRGPCARPPRQALRGGRAGVKRRRPWLCSRRAGRWPRAVDVLRGVAVQLARFFWPAWLPYKKNGAGRCLFWAPVPLMPGYML
jgi:hypothetical protein